MLGEAGLMGCLMMPDIKRKVVFNLISLVAYLKIFAF